MLFGGEGSYDDVESSIRARAEVAEPEFLGQDADIAAITDELESALDVYTPEGGNLLGTHHVESVTTAAVKKLTSVAFRGDRVGVRGEILIVMVDGQQYRLIVERAA